jgi:hypothetical protein
MFDSRATLSLDPALRIGQLREVDAKVAENPTVVKVYTTIVARLFDSGSAKADTTWIENLQVFRSRESQATCTQGPFQRVVRYFNLARIV